MSYLVVINWRYTPKSANIEIEEAIWNKLYLKNWTHELSELWARVSVGFDKGSAITRSICLSNDNLLSPDEGRNLN